jgi:hypothetical protein
VTRQTAVSRAFVAFTAVAALLALVAPAGAQAKKKLPDIQLKALSQLAGPSSSTDDAVDPKHIVVGYDRVAKGTFALQIKNAGKKTVKNFDVSVELKRGGKTVWKKSSSYGEVLPGETRTRSMSGSQKVPLGVYTVLACADPKDDVNEEGEKNNCRKAGTLAILAAKWNATSASALCQPCYGGEDEEGNYTSGYVETEGQAVAFTQPVPTVFSDGTEGFAYRATGTLHEEMRNGAYSGDGSGTAPVQPEFSFLFLSTDLFEYAFQLVNSDASYDLSTCCTIHFTKISSLGPGSGPPGGPFYTPRDPFETFIAGSNLDQPDSDNVTNTTWRFEADVAP